MESVWRKREEKAFDSELECLGGPALPGCWKGRPINDANALTSRRHNSSVTWVALSLSGQGLLEETAGLFENNGIALETSSRLVRYSEWGLVWESSFHQELPFCVRVFLYGALLSRSNGSTL